MIMDLRLTMTNKKQMKKMKIAILTLIKNDSEIYRR